MHYLNQYNPTYFRHMKLWVRGRVLLKPPPPHMITKPIVPITTTSDKLFTWYFVHIPALFFLNLEFDFTVISKYKAAKIVVKIAFLLFCQTLTINTSVDAEMRCIPNEISFRPL